MRDKQAMRNGNRLITAILIIAAVACVFTYPASAASVETTSNYTGNAENDTSITTTVSITSDVVAENVSISINEGDQTYIDYSSISTTRPGGSDIQITNPSQGTYVINELSPGQEWSITFVSYATTIQEENIEVAQIVDSSEQQPGLETTRVTANLSDSSYFRLQETQQTLEQIEQALTQTERELNQTEQELNQTRQELEEAQQTTTAPADEETGGVPLIAGGGAFIGILGFVFAGYFYRESKSESGIQQARKNILDELKWQLIEDELNSDEPGMDLARQRVETFREDRAEEWDLETQISDVDSGPRTDGPENGGWSGDDSGSAGGDSSTKDTDEFEDGDGFGSTSHSDEDDNDGFGSGDGGNFGEDDDSGF